MRTSIERGPWERHHEAREVWGCPHCAHLETIVIGYTELRPMWKRAIKQLETFRP